MAKAKAPTGSFYDENFEPGNEGETGMELAEHQQMIPTDGYEVIPARAYPVSMETRRSRKLARQADLAMQKEFHTAEIVNAGLENTAALARKAKRLTEIVPEAEDDLNYIVHAYADTVVSSGRSWRRS